jgi:prolyl oligopeptidase PreP (S9A serine peptidase family)
LTGGEGYGGFSISIDPFFSSTMLTFLQTYGAILAVPNIRGGAEFGEEWHRAGTREKKVCLSIVLVDGCGFTMQTGKCL